MNAPAPILTRVLAGAAVFGLAPSAAAADAGVYTLHLAGNAAAAFTVRCTLEVPGVSETVDLSGTPPLTRHFHARGLACDIRQTGAGGRLDVELRGRSGNVSRFSTSGKDSVISVSVQ